MLSHRKKEHEHGVAAQCFTADRGAAQGEIEPTSVVCWYARGRVVRQPPCGTPFRAHSLLQHMGSSAFQDEATAGQARRARGHAHGKRCAVRDLRANPNHISHSSASRRKQPYNNCLTFLACFAAPSGQVSKGAGPCRMSCLAAPC